MSTYKITLLFYIIFSLGPAVYYWQRLQSVSGAYLENIPVILRNTWTIISHVTHIISIY